MSAAATLVVIAAVPAVQAYLSGARPPVEAAPRFEQRIPNGLRVVAIRQGSADVLERVELEKGKSVVLATDFEVGRVAVGDPSRAGAVVMDGRTIQIVAKETGVLKAFALHAVDALGLVHALILRLQALVLPFQTLVFGGH